MDFFMTILPYVIAIVVLYIVLKIVSLPFKVIIKFVINSILGIFISILWDSPVFDSSFFSEKDNSFDRRLRRRYFLQKRW